MPPVRTPAPKGPSGTVWFGIVLLVAALAFFGYRTLTTHVTNAAPASAPAPALIAPAPVLRDSAVTPPLSNQPHRVILVG